ncbi:MAG: hypothetical protein GX096_00840 [Clostridiales bacterium]|nr:hypothetical protein [Clostridiales bacterium]
MKKSLSLLLILACILCLCAGTALADQITKSNAEDRLYQLLEEHSNYTRDQLKNNECFYDKVLKQWVLSSNLINRPSDEDGLIMVYMDGDGNFERIKPSEKVSVLDQIANDLIRCTHGEDSYLLLADLVAQWKPRLGELQAAVDEAQQSSSPSFVKANRYVKLMSLDLTMPAKGSLPIDEAQRIATRYIAQLDGWSEEKAAMFPLDMNAYYTPTDIGKPVYFFKFKQYSYSDHSLSEMDEYDQRLTDLFGDKAPMTISIMVDAMDGSLMERPIFDYAPIQYFFLDALIRTDAIIEAGQGN